MNKVKISDNSIAICNNCFSVVDFDFEDFKAEIILNLSLKIISDQQRLEKILFYEIERKRAQLIELCKCNDE